MSVIPEPGKCGQENCESKASLCYIVRPCLKKQNYEMPPKLPNRGGKGWMMAQLAAFLEDLSSDPSTQG